MIGFIGGRPTGVIEAMFVPAEMKDPSMTTIEEFRASLADHSPPAMLDCALQALWWEAKGDWERAHGCVQKQEGTARGDWVHAHLHRVEGDDGNAGYWYRRAGQAVPTISVEDEWRAMTAQLLASCPSG